MATLDEILDAMPDEVAETGREYLTIDPLSRTITVPESERVFAVTGDEYADRKYFRCPRIVGDGLDLAAMFVRVNFRNAGGDEDGYLVDDVAVAGDYVTFSWRLWPKVAEYMGAVQFSVCADLPDTEGRKMPDWNTTLASGEVLEGMHPYDGAVEEETSDVVTQLRAMTAAQTGAVEAVGAQQVQEVQEAANAAQGAAVAAVRAQGEATRASIPADYTALAATVDRLTRDRAAAIVCEAQGAAIQVTDASADPLQGLRIFGRSTQDGTPTPDNPVEIKSLAAPVVLVCGKNLLPYPYKEGTITKNGVTFTVQGDGTIHVKGTAGKASNLSIFSGSLPLKGAFTLSGAANTANPSTHYLQPYVDGVFQAAQFNDGLTYDINGNLTALTLYVKEGATVDCIVRPQLEAGTVVTEYEAPTTRALAITTPNSLPGIPVTSGGNYTDENGQQWIADEVDLARGVYVQRVMLADYDGSDDERWVKSAESYFYLVKTSMPCPSKENGSALATRFLHVPGSLTQPGYFKIGNAYGPMIRVPGDVVDVDGLRGWIAANPFSVLYELATPVETPLTDAEIQAYRALHSVKPTTTLLTDTGAHMALEYAADPKTYIDNKLAALVAAAAN